MRGILETALFVDDLPRACAFYEGVLMLEKFTEHGDGCGFVVAPRQLLLLVRQGKAAVPTTTAGGVVPSCLPGPGQTRGPGHVAFAVADDELDEWCDHLAHHDVDVVSNVVWKRGGRSVYFRDPDGHLLELATPGVWSVY